MRVGVEGEGDGRVSQQFLNVLGMLTHLEPYRGARVAQVVESDVREPGAFQERLETAVIEVLRVHWCALFGGEYEVPVLPRGRGQPLLVMAFAIGSEGF